MAGPKFDLGCPCDSGLEPAPGLAREGTPAAVSPRLVRSAGGRPVCVEVTAPSVGLDHGHRFTVLGNEISMTSSRIQFTGEPTGRPPLPEEVAGVRRHVGRLEDAARTWSDVHREQARRLQAEGLSWSQIAEEVCGDKRFKSTVGTRLRPRLPFSVGS